MRAAIAKMLRALATRLDGVDDAANVLDSERANAAPLRRSADGRTAARGRVEDEPVRWAALA